MSAMQEREDAWRDRLQRWEQSGLNLTAFAMQEGVHPSTLAWWRNRIAERDGKRASTTVALTRVTITPAPVVATQLEVVVSGRTVVRIPTGFCAETLARVLGVLEGRR